MGAVIAIPFSKKRPDPLESERRELLGELHAAKAELERARRAFDYATEPELVEASVYELGALEARYSFALRRLREEGIVSSAGKRGD